MKIRIATRRSALALTQTRWVGARICELDPTAVIEQVQIVTEGDRVLDKPLAAIGGKGLFVSEVEAALTDGRADIAVHSAKDVPAELAEGLLIACVPAREDPRDVLLTREGLELDALTPGARVGTSSLRRSCQLRQRRPDLEYATLRGNVDTRLRKLEEGRYDAIVLAAAGLRRLGLLNRPHWVIPPDACIPAVGQGCLAIEARAEDAPTRAILARLEDPRARVEIEAERALLTRLEAGCRAPVAGHARLIDGGRRLTLDAMVGSIDGTTVINGVGDRYLDARTLAEQVDVARTLGMEVGDNLLARGAAEIIRQAHVEVERSLASGNGGGGKPKGWG